MKTLKIDRKTWIRGNINTPSVLRDEKGNMCCLGFAICQISKIGQDRILNRVSPNNVFRGKSFLTNNYAFCNTFAEQAMGINDDCLFTEEEREQKLSVLFAENGINIVFVD